MMLFSVINLESYTSHHYYPGDDENWIEKMALWASSFLMSNKSLLYDTILVVHERLHC